MQWEFFKLIVWLSDLSLFRILPLSTQCPLGKLAALADRSLMDTELLYIGL